MGGWLDGLLATKRALTVSYADRTWWVAVEDIGLLRDGVGVAVPVGVPTAFTESIDDPLGELLGRYARTHGPFTTHDAAARFGLGLRVTADVLGRMAIDGKLIRGEFTTGAATAATSGTAVDSTEWCDADVLKILRRRSLAALRAQVEPVSTAAFGRFLPAWQQVGSTHNAGVDGLAAVIDQLAGVPIPASAVEPLVFGLRVRDYQPAMLDELLASGEVTWSGAGQIGGGDGWIAFHPADSAPLTLAAPAEIEFTDTHRAIMETLGQGGAYFFRQLADASSRNSPTSGRRAETGVVGADLGRLDHRRHIRTGAGDADGSPPLGRTPRHAGTPATSTPAAVEPLQRRARPGPQLRPDGRGTMVGVALCGTGIHCARAFSGRAAAQPPRRADQGRRDSRRGAGRLRDAL